jgi:acetyl-CoA carboxylase beta subunit
VGCALVALSPQAYTDRIREAQSKTGLQDAVRTGTGLLHGIPIALGGFAVSRCVH